MLPVSWKNWLTFYLSGMMLSKLNYLILKPYEITIIIIAMLQMSKLMLREICPQICNQHLVV